MIAEMVEMIREGDFYALVDFVQDNAVGDGEAMLRWLSHGPEKRANREYNIQHTIVDVADRSLSVSRFFVFKDATAHWRDTDDRVSHAALAVAIGSDGRATFTVTLKVVRRESLTDREHEAIGLPCFWSAEGERRHKEYKKAKNIRIYRVES